MQRLLGVMVMAVCAGQVAAASVAATTAQTQSQPTTQPHGSGFVASATTQATRETEAIQATAEKRTQGILEALALSEPAKETKVRDVLTAFHVKRISWGPNDDRIKDLEQQLIKAVKANDQAQIKELEARRQSLWQELAAMRESLLAELGKVLTAEQIEAVKDQMTYGQAKLLFRAYSSKRPLSDEQKAAIRKLLTDAREEALAAATAADKHRIFHQATEKINAYLDAQKTAPATAPATRPDRPRP